MNIVCRLSQVEKALGSWRGKYIVDECPEARDERILLEQTAELAAYADFRKAIWFWEFDRPKGQEKKRKAA
ncbi:MAG: hypothetical protein WCD20_04960 [Rhodomicrobium sp.]